MHKIKIIIISRQNYKKHKITILPSNLKELKFSLKIEKKNLKLSLIFLKY